ncbi:MAG: D-methionine transport system permease protein [Pseudomonadota bacterium]|jgi:D-methionine transport system permease protein|nr:ABC transporter permease [Burkholderiales bacterium]MBP9769453.1 ABC transporter permease [Burkholderiales bacterium]MDQ5948658.1 D-methionine transport system permease protein [Pseudomonadota bacterium]
MALEIINDLMSNVDWSEINQATLDTLFMLGFAVFFSTIIGIPIGLILFLTSKGRLLQNTWVYSILSFIINVLRSVPFIILLIVMIPATTMLVGTSLGAKGTIPPLVIGAFPFFARLVENALKEIDNGIFHMAESCGASTWQIIWHILLPEITPSLIASITVTAIALVSYTAMAGTVGGGGLGDLAIRYGYQRFQTDVMLITVVLMVVMVQVIQVFGDLLIRIIRKR